MAPSLAVIIPTLNEEELLPRLLRRLSRDEAADRADRIVVADGGSDDGTVECARAAGCDVICSKPGRGVQLAEGARAAHEDVLLFLHADTLPEPGALAALRENYIDESIEASAMSQRIEARGPFYRAVERFADFRSRKLGMVYGDSGLAVRRSLYQEVGGFKAMRLFEDVEFSRRLRRRTSIHLVRNARLWVSARRWKQEGALRCTLRNWMLVGAYFLGRDPEALAAHYAPNLRPEDSR